MNSDSFGDDYFAHTHTNLFFPFVIRGHQFPAKKAPTVQPIPPGVGDTARPQKGTFTSPQKCISTLHKVPKMQIQTRLHTPAPGPGQEQTLASESLEKS